MHLTHVQIFKQPNIGVLCVVCRCVYPFKELKGFDGYSARVCLCAYCDGFFSTFLGVYEQLVVCIFC